MTPHSIARVVSHYYLKMGVSIVIVWANVIIKSVGFETHHGNIFLTV